MMISVNFFLVLIIWSIHISAHPINNAICATIHISSDSSSDNNVLNLFANTMTFKNDLQFFRGAKLFGLSKNCQLEICGYSQNDTSQRRSCEWYTDALIESKNFPFSDLFDEKFVIMFASCTCKALSKSDNCTFDTCSLKNETKMWRKGECAVLYHETNCNTCHFNPVNLMHKHKLLTNHLKSIIVRPGCLMVKETKEFEIKEIRNLSHDQTKYLTGIIETIQPSLYKDMENYTCYCEDSPSPSTFTDSTPTKKTTTTTSPTFTWATAIWFIGLGLIIACVTVIIYFRRHNLHTTFSYSIKNHTNSFQPFKSNENPDTQVEITKEEQGTCLSATDKTLPLESENELKREIMDEVQRLINLRFRTYDSIDDIIITSNSDGERMPSRIRCNKKLTEKFHDFCSSKNDLSRKSFWVLKRDLENPLMSGQFGIVYKGKLKNKQNGSIENVAIKKISVTPTTESNVIKSFFREIKTYEIINNGSANIVEFLGACYNTDGFYVLTRFCEGGSLRQHLREILRPEIQGTQVPILEIDVNVGDDYFTTDYIREQQWQESSKDIKLKPENLHQMLFWCEEIASGMEYLSEKGIIHVDLATRNILLSSTNYDNMKIKICDFGLSRKCLNKEDYVSSLLTGEFPFNSLAPECVTKGGLGKISMHLDIWAYGCTVWEIFNLGEVLYPDASERGIHKFLVVKKLLKEGYRHPKPELAPVYVYDNVMLKCWENDPSRRPTFKQLKEYFEALRKSAVFGH